MTSRPKIYHWLRPLSFLYGLGVRARNRAFDCGWIKQESFGVPTICVGNLAVGGTGKTPHTELLVRLLQPHYKVAVLSRGYRRQTHGYHVATPADTAATIGDEPFQMFSKFRNLTVAVDEDRREGIRRLMAEEKPDAVILDDAFQHRYVKPGLSLLLTTYQRPYYADCLLPAGRLREPVSGMLRASIIIVTKCPPSLTPIEQNLLRKKLQLRPYQELYLTSFSYGKPYPLQPHKKNRWNNPPAILLLSGIAHPDQLLRHAQTLCSRVESLTFADHHAFSDADIQHLNNRWRQLPAGSIVLTTEKDAARLRAYKLTDKALLRAIWIQPVSVCFIDGREEHFTQNILNYVAENTRNQTMD